MMQNSAIERFAAILLLALTAIFAAKEWGVAMPPLAIELTALTVIVLFGLRVGLARQAFIFTGMALCLWLALAGQDWMEYTRQGLDKAAFIAAFFTALSTLRHTAERSPSLGKLGAFLAAQPPGRRYAALTMGGHAFALVINYGSITLLGSLASHAASNDSDPVIRGHRTRRMLLAIQRGFVSSLTWSPLAFSLAITIAIIPGASWSGAVAPGLVSAAIIALTGWAMDTAFKPKLAVRPPRQTPEGSWTLLFPLLALLAVLAITIGSLYAVTNLRIVGIVMVVVPVVSVLWALVQFLGPTQKTPLGQRLKFYITEELSGFRGEIVLLMMAGFIGTTGAPLLKPIILSLGLDLAAVPPAIILAALVWLVPLLGQIGMNPILAVTLIAPLIPSASALGISPNALVAAIVAGWSMSGATSPFTATTLLIGAFGNVSATRVGLGWNGGFFLVTASLLTIWVLTYALVLG
ncbi:hypothetical protein [Roseovarius sp. MMSF_3281]|uniref:hypothetical protein n=1 Tax=Roseovarius sp. MMSF_3281 TaxID=3046694 RepID=UPI00273EE3FA|nr:hypothetical protein [Roseovarius sp. MMSF_3281]